MKTGNPIFNEKRFQAQTTVLPRSESMTVNGTINKTGLLFLILTIGAVLTWADVGWGGAEALSGKAMIGLFGGLVFGLVTAFKPLWAHYTAPIYAFCEGLFLGGLSSFFEARFPGIVMPAVLITLGIMGGMLAVYRTHLIPITQQFRMGVVSATAGIALLYVASMILGMFGVSIPFLFEGNIFGIVFSLFIIGIASLNLLLDFDFIERAVDEGFPAVMEWYAGFGLMVTLVWLYIEVLRLLAKSRR